VGIDLLDMQFRIETAFGLKLERGFFLNIIDKHQPMWREPGQPRPDITVGQIYDGILEQLRLQNRLGTRDEDFEQSLRDSVLRELQARHLLRSLTLQSATCELWRDSVTTQEWRSLGEVLGVQLPALVDRRIRVGMIGGLVIALIPLVAAYKSGSSLLYLPLAICGLLGVVWVQQRTPLELIPRDVETIGGLVDFVVFERMQKSGQGWPENLVWNQLCRIVSDVLGVEEAEVIAAARLVQDLGAD
jgi:hypothetical protein